MLVNSGTLPVQEVLSTLSAAGTCRLAASIPGLSPYEEREGIPAAALPSLQQCYVRSAAGPQSQLLAQGTYATTCNLPVEEGNATVTKSVPFSAELRVTHAPGAFAMPALTRRKFHAPFKATLTITFGAPLRFTAGVRVYSVDEAAVARMPHWAPLAKPLEQLSGGELHQELRLVAVGGEEGCPGGASEGEGGGGALYRASREYAFPVLTFTSPSSMRPRWLVFAAPLPGGPLLLTHFLLPTIVMSRVAEQEEKAAKLLWGDALPERGFSGWALRDFGKYVRRELRVSPRGRELLPGDINALAIKAGFSATPAAAGAGAGGARAVSAAAVEEYRAFRQYMCKTKRLLEAVRHLYERTRPTLICGFATGRHEAEEALRGHPPGTFLVRFASEGGCLALSCATAGGVEHVRVPWEHLEFVALEEAIALCHRAQLLLDVASGARFPRPAVQERPPDPHWGRGGPPASSKRARVEGAVAVAVQTNAPGHPAAAGAAGGIFPAAAAVASGIPVVLARPVEGLALSRVGSLTEVPIGTAIGTAIGTGPRAIALPQMPPPPSPLYYGQVHPQLQLGAPVAVASAAPAVGMGGDAASVPSSREGSRHGGNEAPTELTNLALPVAGQLRPAGGDVGGWWGS